MKHLTTALTVGLAAGTLVLAGCAGDTGYETEETEPTTDTEMQEPVTTGTPDTETDVGMQQDAPMEADLDWGAYEDWDVDGNAEIVATEFDTGFDDLGLHDDWDADLSGDLDSDELIDGYWTYWDTDGDGFVDETEWTNTTEVWQFGDVDYGVYAEWDTDADGQIGEDEYAIWFEDSAWETWDVDGDGALGRDEAADTFFDLFDGNDDDIIDENEWNDATTALTNDGDEEGPTAI